MSMRVTENQDIAEQIMQGSRLGSCAAPRTIIWGGGKHTGPGRLAYRSALQSLNMNWIIARTAFLIASRVHGRWGPSRPRRSPQLICNTSSPSCFIVSIPALARQKYPKACQLESSSGDLRWAVSNRLSSQIPSERHRTKLPAPWKLGYPTVSEMVRHR
jgi:hypothetical protein